MRVTEICNNMKLSKKICVINNSPGALNKRSIKPQNKMEVSDFFQNGCLIYFLFKTQI